MEGKNKDGFVLIKFSNEEAIVFLEWLSRFNEEEDNKFADQAEERILWDIEAVLEKNTIGILGNDYAEALSKARKTVRDE